MATISACVFIVAQRRVPISGYKGQWFSYARKLEHSVIFKSFAMAAKDLEIAQQLDAALIGTVKVYQIDQLLFESLDVCGARSLNQGNVRRLLHRFNKEGCRRSDPLTWITAEVLPSELQQLMTAGSVECLTRENPTELKLQLGCTVRCFQGQHRLAAAKIWLSPDELWWNLILYDSTKLTADARRKLREAEYISQEFSDGDIYRNVRYYQKRGETEPAGEWLARWTPTKCRDFKQIYQPKVDNHRSFRENLDALLLFPALWAPWLMGTHLLSLQCPEV